MLFVRKFVFGASVEQAFSLLLILSEKIVTLICHNGLFKSLCLALILILITEKFDSIIIFITMHLLFYVYGQPNQYIHDSISILG